MRHGNTAHEMKTDGAWAKAGRKHYRHVSGAEVRYDHNAWCWRASNVEGRVWDALWIAKMECEKAARSTGNEADWFA